jgi:DNA-binding transcriptional ArsR family regulator
MFFNGLKPFIDGGGWPGMKAGMGKALRRVFRQDDLLAKVVPRRPGTVSQLMHPVRMSLFSHATSRPCSGLRQLARASSVCAPVAARHLERMRSAGLVTAVPCGNRTAFVPLDMVDPADVRALALVSSEMPRAALRAVVLGFARNQRAVARRLRTYQQEASLVLGKLAAQGLVEKAEVGREVRYSPSVRIIAMADAYEARAPAFRERLLAALDADGLNPKAVGRRGCALLVEADRGVERAVVPFQLNPLCCVLR